MFWEEYITNTQQDEVDKEAFRHYIVWSDCIDAQATREEYIANNVDPDVANEFCYYTPDNWDRLIRWHKEVPGFEEGAEAGMVEKMLRAAMIGSGIDPQYLADKDAMMIHLPGSMLMENYHNLRSSGCAVPPFEEITFAINPFHETLKVFVPVEPAQQQPGDDWIPM